MEFQATVETQNRTGVCFGSGGGSLQTRGAAGFTFRLDLPQGALAEPACVTLAPIASAKGLPRKGGFVAGVQLSPSGLRLASPARFTAWLTAPLPAGQQVGAGLVQDDGTGFEPRLAEVAGNVLSVEVAHFSDVLFESLDAAALVAEAQRVAAEAAAALGAVTRCEAAGLDAGVKRLLWLSNAYAACAAGGPAASCRALGDLLDQVKVQLFQAVTRSLGNLDSACPSSGESGQAAFNECLRRAWAVRDFFFDEVNLWDEWICDGRCGQTAAFDEAQRLVGGLTACRGPGFREMLDAALRAQQELEAAPDFCTGMATRLDGLGTALEDAVKRIFRAANEACALGDLVAEAEAIACIGAADQAADLHLIDDATLAATLRAALACGITLSVSPGSVRLAPGESGRLVATVTDREGDVILGRRLEWWSDAPQVASVLPDPSAEGEATVAAVCPGDAGVTVADAATVAAGVGLHGVNVAQVPVGVGWTLLASPPRLVLAEHEGGRALVRLFDLDGNPLPLGSMSWTSSAPGIAEVSGAGGTASIVGVKAGEALVTARYCDLGCCTTASLAVVVVKARLVVEARLGDCEYGEPHCSYPDADGPVPLVVRVWKIKESPSLGAWPPEVVAGASVRIQPLAGRLPSGAPFELGTTGIDGTFATIVVPNPGTYYLVVQVDAEALSLHGSAEVRAFTTDLGCGPQHQSTRAASASVVDQRCTGGTNVAEEESHTYQDVFLVIPHDLAWLGARVKLTATVSAHAKCRATDPGSSQSHAMVRLSLGVPNLVREGLSCCTNSYWPEKCSYPMMAEDGWGGWFPVNLRLGVVSVVEAHADAMALCEGEASGYVHWSFVDRRGEAEDGSIVPLLRILSCSRVSYFR